MAILVVDLVLAPERELPAHLGLERHEVDAPARRRDVEGAARTGREVRLVQEDAGVADQLGHGLAVLVDLNDVLLLAVVLPFLGGQGGRRLLDPPGVLLVDQVGAVAAAPLHELGGRPGEHALAPVAEDARPVAGEERGVEDPGPLLFVVFEAQPLVRVNGSRAMASDDTACVSADEARFSASSRNGNECCAGPNVPAFARSLRDRCRGWRERTRTEARVERPGRCLTAVWGDGPRRVPTWPWSEHLARP